MGYRWKEGRFISDDEYRVEREAEVAFGGATFITLLVGAAVASAVHLLGVRFGLGETLRFWLVVAGAIAGMLLGGKYHRILGSILATVLGGAIVCCLAVVGLSFAYSMYTGKDSPRDVSQVVRRASAVSTPTPFAASRLVLPAEQVTRQTSYSVTGVTEGDPLVVLSWPDANDGVVARLPNGYKEIRLLGGAGINDKSEWVHISFGNQTGWVKKRYLKSER